MRHVCRRIGLCTLAMAAWASLAMLSVTAEARPLRGPLLRAERRLARAEAALEREAASLPRNPKPAEPPKAATPRPQAAARKPQPAAPRPQAASQPEVARTGYEAPVRPVPTPVAGTSSAAAEPAADGTVSVLVRPEATKADQPAEPLRFPDASAP